MVNAAISRLGHFTRERRAISARPGHRSRTAAAFSTGSPVPACFPLSKQRRFLQNLGTLRGFVGGFRGERT
jgi:hypothetical protein